MEYSDLFARCLLVVLRNEGGYSNDPHDPGGATMKGITQAVYDQYRKDKGLPFQPVIHITDDEVKDIYFTMYWKPMNLEPLNHDYLALSVFDHGVNSGPRTAVKILQRLVGETDDGVVGSDTIRAVREFNGDIEVEYMKRRKLFYVTLVQEKPSLRPFLKGWLKRVEDCVF